MIDTAFLSSIDYLNALDAGQMETLAGYLTVSEHDNGHVFIQEGQPGDTAYVLIEGEVLVSRMKGTDSRIKEINRMGSKEIFGVIALIDSQERTATCRAQGAVKVASLSRDDFNILREKSPATAHQLMRIIARQISSDHQFFSKEIRNVVFSGNAANALSSQDGLIITDTYKGPDRRQEPLTEYPGPERRLDE